MFPKSRRIIVFIIIAAFLSATLIIPTNAYADDFSKYESLSDMTIALSIGALLIAFIGLVVLAEGNKKADTKDSLLNNKNVYTDGKISIEPYFDVRYSTHTGLNFEESNGNSRNETFITGLSFNF